jgi:hypothetical protein
VCPAPSATHGGDQPTATRRGTASHQEVLEPEPTSRAIDGLENALAGLDLLDDALALDPRRPQDYFQRIWNTAFRATDLAASDADTDPTDRTEQAQ